MWQDGYKLHDVYKEYYTVSARREHNIINTNARSTNPYGIAGVQSSTIRIGFRMVPVRLSKATFYWSRLFGFACPFRPEIEL